MNYFRYLEIASRDRKLEILKKLFLTTTMGNSYGNSDFLPKIWEAIVNTDPTKNKQYLQWIINKGINNHDWWMKSNRTRLEDLPTIKDLLIRFDKLKTKNLLKPEHKDINRIKNDEELFDVVNSYVDEKGRTKEQDKDFFDKKGAKKLYESSTMEVIIPLSKEASCYFGVNTKWCTARNDENNAFAVYNREAPLYIVTDKKTGNKYQFWFDTSEDEVHQTMDAKDKPINWLKLKNENPTFHKELIKVFNKVATHSNFTPLMSKVSYSSLINFLYNTDMLVEEVLSVVNLDFTYTEKIDFLKRLEHNYHIPNRSIKSILFSLLKTDDFNKHKDLIKHWPEGYKHIFGVYP